MDKDGPLTIQMEEDSGHWQATQMDDVFLPVVRVSLAWRDLEAAVACGAVLPARAHELWASWAAPGSPLRQTAGARHATAEFQSTLAEFPPLDRYRAQAPALVARVGGPLLGAFAGVLLTWVAVGIWAH